MNKQELIEKYENILKESVPFTVVNIHGILGDLKQLDEPQKVVVPQFVADWIEESKNSCKNVVEFFKYRNPSFEITKWIEEGERFDWIARAWLDGYEVEKEPKYKVKVKGIEKDRSYLAFGINLEIWFFTSAKSTGVIVRHTRKQLEDAGFGWVFDCDGIEIEEVEE